MVQRSEPSSTFVSGNCQLAPLLLCCLAHKDNALARGNDDAYDDDGDDDDVDDDDGDDGHAWRITEMPTDG